MTQEQIEKQALPCPFCGHSAIYKVASTGKNASIGCGKGQGHTRNPLYGCAHFTDWKENARQVVYEQAMRLLDLWNARKGGV